MEIAAHIDALRREGLLMADAADRAGPDAPVPTCPDWTVRDLVRHTGGVHRWATAIVSEPRTEPWDVDLEDVVIRWPDDDDLVDWFRYGHAGLVAALEGAPADLDCWTFLRAPSPLAMWARREAHETAIHRVDAELAAGQAPTSFDPAFAADGVDELVAAFITRRGGKLRAHPPRTLRIRTTDAPGDWLLHIGPDGVETTTGGDETADATVEGPAADLYLTLWSRREPTGLSVEGDEAVLALFLDRVHVRWT